MGSGILNTGQANAETRQITTSEKQFRIKEKSFWLRLKRDIYVFRYLARIVWMWITVGGRIRRAHDEARKTGSIYYIDDVTGGGNV